MNPNHPNPTPTPTIYDLTDLFAAQDRQMRTYNSLNRDNHNAKWCLVSADQPQHHILCGETLDQLHRFYINPHPKAW